MLGGSVTRLMWLVVWLAVWAGDALGQSDNVRMRAHFIEVGQADCTLLEFPCGAILIDVGAESDRTSNLIQYLEEFFQRRVDLDRTIESIIITHGHIDHASALDDVLDSFNVKRVIDNGNRDGRGAKNQRDLAKLVELGDSDVRLIEIRDDQITRLSHHRGLTDENIDPLSCDLCDPTVSILSASHDDDPGWSSGVFENQNNHSLVVRIEFGQSSLLFSGDLEEEAIETLVDYYDGTETLDGDVYQVGHHGSHNGTTKSFLESMSPQRNRRWP